MSASLDELDLKIQELRDLELDHRPQDYSARMNDLLLRRERAQERQFKASLARRRRAAP